MKKLYNKKYLGFFYLSLLGLVSSFSLPPYNFFFLNFITLSLFFIFLIKTKKENKFFHFKTGWIFGFGYFLGSLYWISIALTFDKEFKFLIPISLLLFPSFLAIFFGIVTYLFSFFMNYKNISLIFIFSSIFATIEFIRGNILTGFPWNLFAFSFSKNLEFIQILSIFGTYGFNLICITLFLTPTIIILRKNNKDIILFIWILIMVIFNWIYGYKNISSKDFVNNKENNYLIKIVSPKIKIDRFYDSTNEEEIVENLIELSDPQANIPTIFIWPEGIFTSTYLKDLKIHKKLFQKNFSDKHLIILGINEIVYEDEEFSVYNTLSILNRDLDVQETYFKNNLVPFGEFLPLENLLTKIGLKTISIGYQSFSKGKVRKPININNEYFDLSFLPLICYEIIYSGYLSDSSDYDLIINISEDGWFGNSIGPSQHFSHSIFRSIEEGKNIIRSTNNGISGHINSRGELNGYIESTQGSVIEVTGYKNSKKTLFSKYQHKMFFYLLIFYISFIFFINRGRKRI